MQMLYQRGSIYFLSYFFIAVVSQRGGHMPPVPSSRSATVHMHTHPHTQTHTHNTHIHTHTQTHTHKHTHKHTQTHTHNTYIHTQTQNTGMGAYHYCYSTENVVFLQTGKYVSVLVIAPPSCEELFILSNYAQLLTDRVSYRILAI